MAGPGCVSSLVGKMHAVSSFMPPAQPGLGLSAADDTLLTMYLLGSAETTVGSESLDHDSNYGYLAASRDRFSPPGRVT